MLKFEEILDVVTHFYNVATQDIWIGFHFRHIQNFETHLPRIADFWELQLYQKRTHPEENPFDLITVHKQLKFTIGQLNRWRQIFITTLAEMKKKYPEKVNEYVLWENRVEHFVELFKRRSDLFHNH